MVPATTSLSRALPMITCLPRLFRVLAKFPCLTPDESPLAREITRAPSIFLPRSVGVGVPASYARITGSRV